MLFKRTSIKQVLPPPVEAFHKEYSMILSQHDDPFQASPELIHLSLEAIRAALSISLKTVYNRRPHVPAFVESWPGEHYKLLAGFVKVLKPKCVIEVGTSTGLSILSITSQLPHGGKALTFDVVPWNSYPNTVLKEEDFTDGTLIHFVDDLSQKETFEKYKGMFADASLIFIDATHDGILEKTLLENLKSVPFHQDVFILFDDIRVWSMLKMWRQVQYPKLDLTSFGHWSGTGLIQFFKNSSL